MRYFYTTVTVRTGIIEPQAKTPEFSLTRIGGDESTAKMTASAQAWCGRGAKVPDLTGKDNSNALGQGSLLKLVI